MLLETFAVGFMILSPVIMGLLLVDLKDVKPAHKHLTFTPWWDNE